MLARLLLVITLALLCPACERKSDAPPATATGAVPAAPPAVQNLPTAEPLTATLFLSKRIPASVIESTNEALPIWRRFAKNRPLLAIVAQDPALAPIPEEKLGESAELLRNPDDKTLKLRTGLSDPDPVFLPQMSVTAALNAGWLDGVVWVFPTTGTPETLNPELFRQQITEAGIATPAEAAALRFEAGVFRGTVHGRTFIAAPSKALPTIDQPLLLHIDCDYFKPLYKGEIKTPLYPLLLETLAAIQEKQWQVAEATVARSTLGSELPLATRFVAGQIVDIINEPEMLAGALPDNWAERADALYLENFLQKDKIKEIYQRLVKDDPADPSLSFALYQINRQYAKGGNEALEHLQVAVQIDPLYALEYLALAELALQKQKPEQAMRMLRLARTALPDDPFVLMQFARTMLNTGDRKDAATVQTELQKLNWSSTYYADQIEARDGLIDLLKN